MIPYPRPGTVPSRSALVGGLLVLTLGLAGVLAYQAWDATRSHQRIAEATLEEHAQSAAWQLTQAMRRNLEGWYLWPGLQTVGKSGGIYPGSPLKGKKEFERHLEDNGWPFWKSGFDFYFRLDLETKKLDMVGDSKVGHEVEEWLTKLLEPKTAPLKEGEKAYSAELIIHGPPGEERVLVLEAYPEPGPKAKTIFGFQTDLAPLKTISAEIAASQPLLPPTLTDGEPTAKLLSFFVATPSGSKVFFSSPQYDSGFQAEDTVGTMFGGLSGVVSLNPEAADFLVIGGTPKSRIPTILGLMVLASGLVIVAIIQLRREQELALLRTDFVSSVSHQLRTPLAQIRMFGETLLLGRVRSEDERRRSLEIIVKEAQGLTHQVDNVLHFSRAQRGEVRLNPRETQLAPVIEEVLEGFCPLAEVQGCRIEASLDDTLTARVDPASIRQILLNLLENAVKYGPADQIIDVRLRKRAGGTVQLLVEDEGEGIPEEQREEVFSAYSRLDRHRDSGVAGSGIGLAVVKELAVRQGGWVRVEEAVSGGARFVVAFPRGRDLIRPASPSDAFPEAPPAEASTGD